MMRLSEMRLVIKTLIMLSLFGAVAYGDNWLNSPYNPANLSTNNPLNSPFTSFNGGNLPTAPAMTTIAPGCGSRFQTAIFQSVIYYPVIYVPVYDANGNLIGYTQGSNTPPANPDPFAN